MTQEAWEAWVNWHWYDYISYEELLSNQMKPYDLVVCPLQVHYIELANPVLSEHDSVFVIWWKHQGHWNMYIHASCTWRHQLVAISSYH